MHKIQLLIEATKAKLQRQQSSFKVSYNGLLYITPPIDKNLIMADIYSIIFTIIWAELNEMRSRFDI